MPYKDKEIYKEYQYYYQKTHREQINNHRRKQYASNRIKFIFNKSCPYCGEDDSSKLVLHHLFQRDIALERPMGNSGIWRWSESRRVLELLKCLVVCKTCHDKIHWKIRKNNENTLVVV